MQKKIVKQTHINLNDKTDVKKLGGRSSLVPSVIQKTSMAIKVA